MYWGYNPLTNLLLTSWDIQVPLKRTTCFVFLMGFLKSTPKKISLPPILYIGDFSKGTVMGFKTPPVKK